MKNNFLLLRTEEEKQKKRCIEKRAAFENFLIQSRSADTERRKQTKFIEEVAEQKKWDEVELQIQIIQTF